MGGALSTDCAVLTRIISMTRPRRPSVYTMWSQFDAFKKNDVFEKSDAFGKNDALEKDGAFEKE